MINKNVSVWVEINANRYRITDKNKMEEVFKKLNKSGIGTVLLSVKDTTGFGIYKSKYVPHYSKINDLFEDFDYLAYYIDLAKKYDLRVIPSIDVFAEGSIKNPNSLSKSVSNPEFETVLYLVDKDDKPYFKRISENMENLYTEGLVENYFASFVNPIREDVREYELNIIKEIASNYDVEGICLDRVRFVGFGADFSEYSKTKFQEFIGTNDFVFPDDIMKLHYEKDKKVQKIMGKYYSEWQCFRAHYLKKFIIDVKKALDKENVKLWDYTGNWYYQYDDVAANWASCQNLSINYPGVDNASYAKEGYAEYIDVLLSGTYYKSPEAIKYGIEVAKKVTCNKTEVYGSVGLWEFSKEKELAEKCFDASIINSNGCMIFDLCYLDDYDYYDIINVNKEFKK